MFKYIVPSIISLILIQFASAQTVSNSPNSVSATHSKAQQNKKLAALWRSSILGLSSTGEKGDAKLIGFTFDVNSQFKLSNNLNFIVNPLFKFSNGSTQSFDTSDKTENKVTLNHAAIELRPNRNIELAAGTLNQEKIHSNIFVETSPFPAARLTMKNDLSEGIIVGGIIQTAMPTTSSMSSNTGEKEETPSLNTASIKLNAISNIGHTFKLHLGAFKWENIPSAVANKAYALGNTVNLISDVQGNWVYDYQGVDGKVEAAYVGTYLSIRTGIDYLKNNQAPESKNTAYNYWGLIGIPLNSDNLLEVQASRFRIESDATIAYFSPTKFYNTNRNGYSVEAKYLLPKDSYSVSVRYTEADLLILNPIQTKERNIFLKLETSYVSF